MTDAPVTLHIDQPFDLTSSLNSGQSHRWVRTDSPYGPSNEWRLGIMLGHLVQIRQVSGNGMGGTSLELRSDPPRDPDSLMSLVRRYFRLDDDIEGIYHRISSDSRVAEMVQQYRGLRLLRLDPWECFVAFICSANSNIPRIHQNMESMATSFGEPLTIDGQVRYSFPSPAEVGRSRRTAPDATWASGSGQNTWPQAPVWWRTDELDLDKLTTIPYAEAKERLMTVPGIGPKVADCILLHSLDKLEAFPIDVWVRRALSEWYFPGMKPPTDRVMLEWAQDYFGNLGGYSQLYLFHGRRLQK